MATGGGYPSMSRESEVFESECFNCSQEGKHVEAEVYCVECEDNFCRGCLNVHNMMARLRTHEIQGKSFVKPGVTQGLLHPPTVKCLEHLGRLIDTYCVSHDVVCCSACMHEDHKSCPDMKYIPTVSSGISTSKELQDAQTTTMSVKTQLDKVKTMQLENLTNVRNQRIKALERANGRKRRIEALEGASLSMQQLKQFMEEFEEKTSAEIKEKYKKLEDAINDDLDELNTLITTLDDAQSQLKKSQNNETKLFVHLKQNKRVISAGRKLATSCMMNAEAGCCTFVTDDSIEMYLNGLESLGSFEEDSEYSAVHVSDENIQSSTDTDTCDITGICSLDDGSLMIADFTNKCIKQLDESFHVESRCDLSGYPFDVCQTSSTEVAVIMWDDKKIQFVSVGQTMSLIRSITTTRSDGYRTGIACKDGNLYVSRDQGARSSCVQVYDMRGSLLRIIQKDKSRSPIFNHPYSITINARSSNIYVADYDNGIIILDKSGQLVAKITDPDLSQARGICVLPGDQLLVCGISSHNVIQFDGQGKKVRTLLTAADGLEYPQSLRFDPGTRRLIVGMDCSNTIKVFSLVKQ